MVGNDSVIETNKRVVRRCVEEVWSNGQMQVIADLIHPNVYRHPDRAVFAASSLNGLYVGASFGDGGQSPAAGFGFVRYDGQGRFGETNVANIQGDTTTSRRFVDGADEGAYTLDADGFGSVGDGGVRILVTHAMAKDDLTRVEAYAFIVQGLVPATGVLFTGTVRRGGD